MSHRNKIGLCTGSGQNELNYVLHLSPKQCRKHDFAQKRN